MNLLRRLILKLPEIELIQVEEGLSLCLSRSWILDLEPGVVHYRRRNDPPPSSEYQGEGKRERGRIDRSCRGGEATYPSGWTGEP